MSSTNYLFPSRGTRQETTLVENLIDEAIRCHGQELFYIPRTLVAVDSILGEDRLSEFKGSYKVACYLDNVDNFGGSGGFLEKFGYFVGEQATFTITRREWQGAVGRFGVTIIPERPCEGDLLWFPMTDSLFEIKYVDHQGEGAGGFYQLGKLYSYKLKCELFSFSSERFDTGIDEVDNYALSATFDLLSDANVSNEANVADPLFTEQNGPIAEENLPPKTTQVWDKSDALNVEAEKILDDIEKNPFADF